MRSVRVLLTPVQPMNQADQREAGIPAITAAAKGSLTTQPSIGSWILLLMLATALAAPAQADDDTAPNELVDAVVKLLHDDDVEVRGLALEQIRYFVPGEAATRRFAAEVDHLVPAAQVGLLRALAERGDRAAHQAVLKHVRTGEDDSVRAAALFALARLGTRDDVALLVAQLASDRAVVVAAAREGLVDLAGPGVPETIATALADTAPSVRAQMIYVLSDRRAIDTVPQILEQARADDREVRQAAMVALSWLASPVAVPDMVPALLAIQDRQERAAAEKAIMKICAKIADRDEQARPLIAAMANLDEADRLALLSLMGRVGGAAAREEIEKAIASTDAKARETGLKALSNWPSAAIAPRYLELIEEVEEPAHRRLMLRALIRVAPLRDGRSHAERLELLRRAMSLATGDEERRLALKRAAAIRDLQTLRFVVPYLDEAALSEAAALAVVELAHHRNLREPNKAEFHAALDKVIATSRDEVVLDRANRYKLDRTWVRPR
ncbi:MAG: hypothetical protein DWQ42_22480 [Planctomycetota bacterium]|nr:MAG: hypothetical protein DWQ42_22480 [Planctomycetota bacterium]